MAAVALPNRLMINSQLSSDAIKQIVKHLKDGDTLYQEARERLEDAEQRFMKALSGACNRIYFPDLLMRAKTNPDLSENSAKNRDADPDRTIFNLFKGRGFEQAFFGFDNFALNESRLLQVEIHLT